MKKYLYLIFLLFSFFSCKQSSSTVEKVEDEASWNLELPAWAGDATIYEVNIRQYSEEGSFNAFTRDIPRLKELGVEILWLMPIFPISETKKKGSLGSYYAVSNFREVNPEFGTMEDFDKLVATAHENDLKVILDWVPNHTGWDHIWIKEHPDYYTQDSAGNIIDPINYETGESWGWTDVADLNYDNPDMRKEMLADIKYWVTDHQIDGFRMDVAHGVPLDFWQTFAKEMVSLDSSLFLLAESQVPEQLSEEYFHMGYGWDFHHLLNEIAHGEKDANDLFQWLSTKDSLYGDGVLMHFTSNHDENSWAGTVFERMGDAHLAMAVITFTFDGMPLIYSGMEEPMRKRLAFFEKDPIGFKDYAYSPFYEKLIDLKKKNQALWNGQYGGPVKRIGSNPQVLAFTREKNEDKVAVIINLSDQNQMVQIEDKLTGMKELFSGKSAENYNWMRMGLSPYEYLVFSNK